MAHRIDGRKLGRKTGPRMALYRNLIVSVLRYEQIKTTEARAKEVRGQVEQVITLAKEGTLASRRRIVAELPNEPLVIDKLINEIAPKYGDRSSGYTRIVKIGLRAGDAPRWSSSSSSEIPPESWPAKQIAREGGPVRYSARVEYDGTDFAGFQVQPGGGPSRESWNGALAQHHGGGRIRVDGAGRTDAGVHASGQVIAFTYSGRLGRARSWVRALRRCCRRMSDSGRCAGWRPASSRAIGRGDANTDTASGTGLQARCASDTPWASASRSMCRRWPGSGQALVGRHDFSAFGGKDRQPIRTLHGCGPQEGSAGHRSTWSATRSCARWCDASWPRSCASGTDRQPRRIVEAALRSPDRRSPERPPRHMGCASGGSTSARPTSQMEQATRMMNRTYTPRASEIERQLVRRRRGRPAPRSRSPRASRRARGQAQAHVRHAH